MRRIRSHKPPEPRRIFECPQCGKSRMSRPLDHVVSKEKHEYKTFKGDTVELHIDVCDFCVARNNKKYFEPSPADIKTFLKAMKEVSPDGDDVSLEDLL